MSMVTHRNTSREYWWVPGFEEAISRARIMSKKDGRRYRVEQLKISGTCIRDKKGVPYFKVFSY